MINAVTINIYLFSYSYRLESQLTFTIKAFNYIIKLIQIEAG